MSKFNSENKFIKNLRFHLSFYFNDIDISNIISDYEEWFENEKLHGKTEKEICNSLQNPVTITQKLHSEFPQKHLFTNNTTIQMLLIIIIHFLSNVLCLNICNKYTSNFLAYSLLINFLLFIIPIFFIKSEDKNIIKTTYFSIINNIFLFGIDVSIVLLQNFFLPNLRFHNSGKICTYIITLISLILFLINIYFCFNKLYKNKFFGIITIFHICTEITLLLYCENQLHMLSDTISEFRLLMFGNICIYFELLLLCIIFYILNLKLKEK